jgi:5-bromo-4-chloroindolyl phosphate hydrolysis protein
MSEPPAVARARRAHVAGSHVVGRTIEDLRARWRRFSARGLLLYALPVPLFAAVAVSLLRGDYPRLGGQVLALALLYGGAASARRGLRAEDRWRRRRVVRAPRPWKTLGAGLLAAGGGVLAGGAIGHPWPVALGYAAATFAGFALAYGLDPRRAKPAPLAADGYTTQEIEAEIDRAEAVIARIESARARIGPGELSDRLLRITALARELVAHVEQEPRHLRRARRFLFGYLDGARQVCEGWDRTHGRRPAALDERFRRVLVTIEEALAAQQTRLLADEVQDLDVQVEVLEHQLRREGIA